MKEINKRLLKVLIISSIIGIFFFFVIDTITKYIVGGIASNYGLPFTYYYDYYFSPGVEFSCPILWSINLVLFCLFFITLGLIYLLFQEKKKEFKIIYAKILSVVLLSMTIFSIVGFLICPFPDMSHLPEPGEYIDSSYVSFHPDQDTNRLYITQMNGAAEINWNDTTVIVDGNILEWSPLNKTWKYDNIEIIHDKWKEGDVNYMNVGEFIANCTGVVSITYNPSGVEFGSWEFT